ncbi:MAG TPA: hypothetical protein P5089_03535 [Candidatus Portnoybacteria bacterium]|nr:hypothetical protein [Candidatus Portnoybacteria bacterium]
MKKFNDIFEKVAVVALSLIFPTMVLAADINSTITRITDILNMVIGLLFVLVTLYFVWGIVQYVMAAGDEGKIKDGKQHMIWGIIGMAVMAGAWGIVRIITSTFLSGNSTGIPTGVGSGL